MDKTNENFLCNEDKSIIQQAQNQTGMFVPCGLDYHYPWNVFDLTLDIGDLVQIIDNDRKLRDLHAACARWWLCNRTCAITIPESFELEDLQSEYSESKHGGAWQLSVYGYWEGRTNFTAPQIDLSGVASLSDRRGFYANDLKKNSEDNSDGGSCWHASLYARRVRRNGRNLSPVPIFF